MSEYGFGYEDAGMEPDLSETNANQQGPKWFREGLAKLSGQVNELQAENKRLKEAQVRSQVADTLKAKGFSPQAAGLYQGEPAGLDDWLSANGAALAKLPSADGETVSEEPQVPGTVPQSVVSPESQAQLARMQSMGAEGVAAPAGSDNDLAAKIAAFETEAELDAFMRSNQNRFF